jgi:hypothetical protein
VGEGRVPRPLLRLQDDVLGSAAARTAPFAPPDPFRPGRGPAGRPLGAPPAFHRLVEDVIQLGGLDDLQPPDFVPKLGQDPPLDAPEHLAHGGKVDIQFLADAPERPAALAQVPGPPLALAGHLTGHVAAAGHVEPSCGTGGGRRTRLRPASGPAPHVHLLLRRHVDLLHQHRQGQPPHQGQRPDGREEAPDG